MRDHSYLFLGPIRMLEYNVLSTSVVHLKYLSCNLFEFVDDRNTFGRYLDSVLHLSKMYRRPFETHSNNTFSNIRKAVEFNTYDILRAFKLWIFTLWSLRLYRYSNIILFCLLFISYKLVKGFSAITFLLLVFSNWNFHDVCQCFLYNQEQNFRWIRQKWDISP